MPERDDISNSDSYSVHTESLSKLFIDHHKQVYRIAYRITLSHKDAEDIVQDVFVKLYYKLPQYKASAKISTWIYRITVNTSIDARRHLKKWDERKPLHLLSKQEGIDGAKNSVNYSSLELSEILNKAMTNLKKPFRVILILRNFEDFSYDDIADILNISKGTVASRLNRAYTKLKIELEKLGINEDYLTTQ